MFDIQVAHSVEEIGQEAWNFLSKERPCFSYRWFCYAETVLTDDTPIYIVLSQREEPIACATFWLRRQQPLYIASRAISWIMETVFRRRPLLLCEAPLAPASGLILPASPLRERAVEVIAQAAQAQAQRHRASFVGCVYLEEQEAKCAGWPSTFAAFELPDAGTYLPIIWPDFESYIRHLSKSTRKDYRRHRNRATDFSIELKRYSKVNDVEKALELIRNVEKHHGSVQNLRAQAMLENAGMVGATWLAAEIEGRLVGCGLLLNDRGTWMMTLLGLDYDVQYAYFQLAYGAIQCAIEEGARVLWGGARGYEMKQKLGFQLTTNNYTVFAGSGPLLQKLGSWMAGKEESRVTNPYED
jgi:predicted N-acyltransferase